MIDVFVTVLPDGEKSTPGTIDEFATLQSVLSDIVTELQLGDPSDWQLAVASSNVRSSLADYKPSTDDTIFLIRRELARGKAFRIR